MNQKKGAIPMTALQKHEQKNRVLQFLKECFNLSLDEPFSISFNDHFMRLTAYAEQIQKYYYRINSCFEINKIRKEDFIQKSALKILEDKDWMDCGDRDERELEWSMILNYKVNIKIIDSYKEQSKEEFLTLLKFLHNNDFDYLGLDVEGKKLIASNMMPVRTTTKNGSIILQWQDDKQMTLPYKEDYLSFFGYPDKSSPIILKVKPYLMQAIDYHIFKNE